MNYEIQHGDCVELMAAMPEASVDAIVTDPPYALNFMSRAWDSFSGSPVDPAFLYWLAGFTDGEGCFSVHKKNVNGYETYDCQFSITLRADDRPILERIHRTLGIGTLSKPTAHRTGEDNPKARYSVSAKAELVALRDIFRAFPLRAKKARDFELWSDALDAWLHHEPGEWADMAEARSRLMTSREYVEPGIRVDPFQMWSWRWAREAHRVLKPGGHLLAFGGTRTFHRLTCALEDAGFEIRDCLSWMYGSGFPKSLDVSKAIDKAAGAEREVLGRRTTYRPNAPQNAPDADPTAWQDRSDGNITAAATDDARRWQGWGTALKPAWEPIILARKPLVGTVAGNVQAHGTGALNVDGCRIGTSKDVPASAAVPNLNGVYGKGWDRTTDTPGWDKNTGRWPANVLLTHSEDCREVGTRKVKATSIHGTAMAIRRSGAHSEAGGHQTIGREQPVTGYADADGLETVPAWDCAPGCPVRMLDEQSGELQAPVSNGRRGVASASGFLGALGGSDQRRGRNDSGGASRFFYTAKSSSGERHYAGKNSHPTVKPVDLMRWLCRLVTPPGGLVLDPFMGSGSTGIAALSEGFRFLGMEKDADSIATARRRIAGPLFAEANP